MLCALRTYHTASEAAYRRRIEYIENRTGIELERNKRNGRKQSVHLRIARSTLEIMNEVDGQRLQGRPTGSGTAEQKVAAYRADHQEASVTEVARELGISRTTVYKWWDASPSSELDLKAEPQ